MRLAALAVLILLSTTPVRATTVDGRFVVLPKKGGIYCVKMQLRTDVGMGLGGTTLKFSFNNTNLRFPASPAAGVDYSFPAFSGGLYSPGTVTVSGNVLSVNTEYNGPPGNGTPVGTSYTDVVTVNFRLVRANSPANLQWTQMEILGDDYVRWTNGLFPDADATPLPAQLSAFTATLAPEHNAVALKWSTVSETEIHGYEVQKARSSTSKYVTIENSFVAGHGTSAGPHHYAFTEKQSTPVPWYYRVKQIDLDGTARYGKGIRPSDLSGTDNGTMPNTYAFDQTTSSPFNPVTGMSFSLPKESSVRLEVFDCLGQRAAVLVDQTLPAGYYRQKFDGTNYGSGIYLCRITAGDFRMTRKLLLVNSTDDRQH